MSDKALLEGWFHCDTTGLDGVIVIFADSSVGSGFDVSQGLQTEADERLSEVFLSQSICVSKGNPQAEKVLKIYSCTTRT